MFATLLTFALFATSVLGDFSIDTPTSVSQCTPLKLNWAGGKAPYNLIVVAADDPCGDVITDLGDHQGNSLTWTPTLKSGQKVMLSLQDADEEEAWSGSILIGEGSDSCVSASSTPASSSSTSTATTKTSATTAATTTGYSNPQTSAGSNNAPVGAAGADPLTADSGAAAKHFSLPVLAISAIVAVVTLF